jgi:hypothetical protein
LNELGQIDQDAGYWLFYNPDTTARTPVFTYSDTNGATNIGGWWEQGLAFKSQAAAGAAGGLNKRQKYEQMDP